MGAVRWRLVVPAALVAMLLSFLIARLFVYVWDDVIAYPYSVGSVNFEEGAGNWSVDDIEATEGPFGSIFWAPRIMGAYGLPALHFLTVFLGAAWVARRAGEWRTHGLLVGLLATFYGQIAMLILWPTTSFSQALSGWGLLALPFPRAAGYLVLGLAGGFLGGFTARMGLARREALVRASREIGAAREPNEIPAAIGRRLAGRRTAGVALWEAIPPNKGNARFRLLDSWTPRDARNWPPVDELDAARVPALTGLRGQAPLVVKASGLPEAEREGWAKAEVRSLLVVPLIAPQEKRVGLLSVASRRRWWPFSGGAVRRYSTVATQAALALENMRLVEEARRVGQEAGTLRERDRLAREIHDTLAQGFVSIVMSLEASEDEEASAALRRRQEGIERTARESLSEARRLVRALGPAQLEEASLPEALEELARRFSGESGVKTEAVVDGDPVPLSAGAEAALLRVAQEALHNVRKHAGAERVMISLSYMGDRVVLDVRDDGVGFDPEEVSGGSEDGISGGFGLSGMGRRIEEEGGTLKVESAPGEGTTLTVEMPAEASSVGQQPSGELV